MPNTARLTPDTIADFERTGFHIFEDLLPIELVEAAQRGAEGLFQDFPHETGAILTVDGNAPVPLERLARIDHPHLASEAIDQLLHFPALARAATALMKSDCVQAWYVHLSRKPPVSGARSHIGWHQDGQYTDFIEGRFVTMWIPLTEVGAQDSPICYVPGSHHSGVIGGSGFSGEVPLEALKARLLARAPIEWTETEVCARRGTVTMHDSLVVHGSRKNNADRPRLALTVHLRSEHNRVRFAPEYRITMKHLRDSAAAPILCGNRMSFSDLDIDGDVQC